MDQQTDRQTNNQLSKCRRNQLGNLPWEKNATTTHLVSCSESDATQFQAKPIFLQPLKLLPVICKGKSGLQYPVLLQREVVETRRLCCNQETILPLPKQCCCQVWVEEGKVGPRIPSVPVRPGWQLDKKIMPGFLKVQMLFQHGGYHLVWILSFS